MKKTALLALGFFAISACNAPDNNTSENNETQTATEETIIGGDRDEHGCLSAAGETWSEIKQTCVQIFDIGQRLNPIEVNESDATFSAFVLFNDDRSKLELFLPGKPETIILDKDGNDVYQNDSLKFDSSISTLYVDNEAKYKGE